MGEQQGNGYTPSATTELLISRGQALAFFAFDIGYEVSLEQVGELLSSFPVAPLSRKKQTPTYLQYTDAPLVHPLGNLPAFQTGQGGLSGPGQIQATIFEFGAVSISYRWPLESLQESESRQTLPLADLPELSRCLSEQELEPHARQQVMQLLEQIRPAVTRPDLSDLVEDYYVFILEEFSQAELGYAAVSGKKMVPLAEDLLAQYATPLAQALQFDTERLSAAQQQATLARAISYYENDLVLIDWNASIICDSDYLDTLNVLELLNVELLEARYMDALLDKRLKGYEKILQRQPSKWALPLHIPYRQSINELAELRIEASLLEERVDNSLKLIGDLYLARVYSAASEQFYLPTWDTSISRKLDIIANLYQLLTDRVSTSQGQTLELIIIILILLEILLNLLHH
jgi:hypothetical protein